MPQGPLVWRPLGFGAAAEKAHDLCDDDAAIEAGLDGGALAEDRANLGIECADRASPRRYGYLTSSGALALGSSPGNAKAVAKGIRGDGDEAVADEPPGRALGFFGRPAPAAAARESVQLVPGSLSLRDGVVRGLVQTRRRRSSPATWPSPSREGRGTCRSACSPVRPLRSRSKVGQAPRVPRWGSRRRCPPTPTWTGRCCSPGRRAIGMATRRRSPACPGRSPTCRTASSTTSSPSSRWSADPPPEPGQAGEGAGGSSWTCYLYDVELHQGSMDMNDPNGDGARTPWAIEFLSFTTSNVKRAAWLRGSSGYNKEIVRAVRTTEGARNSSLYGDGWYDGTSLQVWKCTSSCWWSTWGP